MGIRTLIGLAVIVACTGIPFGGPVAGTAAQTPLGGIAYDQCYFDEIYGYFNCDVRVWADGTETVVASGGAGPRWSPDAYRIVFVGTTDENYGDILVVNLGDLSVVNLTSHPAHDSTPAWSADGTKIAFVSNRSGALELYLMNDDGTGLVPLTNAIGFTGRFAWSPDGSSIAFARDVDGVRDLYKMNADGSNLVRLTFDAGFTGEFAWAPDGTRIAFDCAAEVCAINGDGTGLAQLTTGSGHGGVFAPVDGRVAFVTERFGQGSEIAVMEEDGTVVRVAPGTAGHGPVWSPDGASLLFDSIDPVDYWGCCAGACNADTYCVPVYGIYAVNADGTDLQVRAIGTNPDWFRPHPGQPLASFTDQCTGSSCTFDATGSSDSDGAIESYSWQFGDGTDSTGSTASHTYATGGSYIVTLAVVDNDGRRSVVSRRVVANAPPVASFTVVCNGPTCTFDGSASTDLDGTIEFFNWNFGDGYATGSLDRIVTHTYATGTFTVQLVVTDNAGAGATATTTLELVNAPPVARFTWACDVFTCAFDASASADADGTIRSFFWQFGDSPGGGYGAAITTHSYIAPGTYNVVLTVADDARQEATHTETIVIPPAPMHVGDLDRWSYNLHKSWNAFVRLEVHGGSHQGVGNVVVTGSWDDGTGASCTTDAIGRCEFSKYGIAPKAATVTLTVTSATHAAFVYRPASNHDPDGDSDGTVISIPRR